MNTLSTLIVQAMRCEDRRMAFEARLRGLLAEDGSGLHAATMGRDGGGFVWILTLGLPRGLTRNVADHWSKQLLHRNPMRYPASAGDSSRNWSNNC